MAFNLNNLLSTLDSSIGLLDSSSDLLSILQAINVTNPTMGHGKSQKKTYATRASLPAASVSLRGSLAVVQVIGNWEASGNADNGLYVCTGNDWALVQGLDSAGTPPPPFQGSTSGYTSGGSPLTNIIDKYAYASDGNATDVGDLTAARVSTGQSSANHGYSTGYASGGATNTAIDKFSFATDGNATDVGDLAVWVYSGGGQSSITNGFGYHTGGQLLTPPSAGATNNIQKFAFATDGDGTDVSDLSLARYNMTGQSSSDNGYTSGGIGAAGPTAREDVIDKFPFASDVNATDVGNLTIGRYGLSGQSSSTHGYSSGGFITTNTIDKFSFSADGNATDVGDLTGGRYLYTAGTSSTASGYATGPSSVIDKFPFASDGNATDVGDLTVARSLSAGQQI